MYFFDILMSKNGPELRCFVHFDLEMYFTPRRRGVDFFEILIGKSGPTMMDFVKGNWEAILPNYE